MVWSGVEDYHCATHYIIDCTSAELQMDTTPPAMPDSQMETTPPAMPDLRDGNDTGGDAKSLRPWKYILPTAETMLHIHG